MKSLARKVAARVLKTAEFLDIGDRVLYGKYKNGVAIIKGWAKDKWGNPTVVLEKVTKDGRPGKIMVKQLFTIWKAEIKEKALLEQSKQASLDYYGTGIFAVCPTCQRVNPLPDDTQDEMQCPCGAWFRVIES